MTYQITNQRDLRKAFWQTVKDNPIPGVAFSDWLDCLCRNGVVSQELAQRATLS